MQDGEDPELREEDPDMLEAIRRSLQELQPVKLLAKIGRIAKSGWKISMGFACCSQATLKCEQSENVL